jgi:hypothetical protein
MFEGSRNTMRFASTLIIAIFLILAFQASAVITSDGDYLILDHPGSGEGLKGDLAYTGDAFYALYPKEYGIDQSSLYLYKFNLAGATVDLPVEFTNAQTKFHGPRMCWTLPTP